MRLVVRTLLGVTLLAASAFSIAATPPDDSVLLNAAEDSYVVADVSAPDDPQGLRDKNFGGLDFLKIWYANQVQANEQVVSVGLVKFDLTQLSDRDIRSAHLQLFAQRADLLQPVRLVDVSLAEGAWNQGDVTFKTLPQITQPPLASAAVYAANVWYSWDVTPAVVRKTKEGSVAYAVGLRTLETKGEEQVVFASSEAGRNAPRLMVTMAPAAAAIPPYLIAAGVVLAAVLAFGGGLFFGRRRRAMARATSAQAIPLTRTAGAETDEDALIECPTCHRQIPAVAQTCPRCGARVAEPSVR
jgi:zinc ribbon protein